MYNKYSVAKYKYTKLKQSLQSGGNLTNIREMIFNKNVPDTIIQKQLEKDLNSNFDINDHLDKTSRSTLLSVAVINNRIEIVKLLLSKGANINSQNATRSTPLYYAVSFYYINIIKLLINNGADVNISDINGNTPLHVACINGDYDIIKLLIDNNANINLKNSLQYNPLEYVVYKAMSLDTKSEIYKNYIKTINFLLDNQFQVDNELKLDVSSKRLQEVLNIFGGRTETIHDMMTKHAPDEQIERQLKTDLNNRNFNINDTSYGYTLLSTAILYNRINIVELLLNNGADVNIRFGTNNFALNIAINKEDRINIVKLLLDRGANVNTRDINGNTPLYNASNLHFHEIIKLLLNYNADINLPNNNDYTPLDVIVMHAKNAYNSYLKSIVEKSPDTYNLPHYNRNIETIKLLLDNNANVTDRTITYAGGCEELVDILNSGPLIKAAHFTGT